MATKPNTDHKEPKTFQAGTYWLSMALNTVLTLIIGVVLGYVLVIGIQSNARASVHADLQLVSKEQARQQ